MASIAQLRQEAEQRYTDLPLELDDGTTVRLRNFLRLDEDAQQDAQTLLGAINDTSDGNPNDPARIGRQMQAICDFLALIADQPEVLRPALGGWDLPLLMVVIESYTEATQLPEAPSSAS